VFNFWMEHGVDGFRVDALPFLFEISDVFGKDEPKADNPSSDLDENDYDFYTHPYTMDLNETYDMLAQWRQVVDQFPDKKPRAVITECYTNFENTIKYYGTQEKLGAHFTFNFQLISYANKSSTAAQFKFYIDQWMGAMGTWRVPNWVIGNHDNSRVATRFPNLADGMNMISLTLPGTAMTYNGEEIGMTDAFIRWEETVDPQALNEGPDKFDRVSRDKCRTPMQWNDTTSAGFSTNATTWMPTNPNYWDLNVEKQLKADRSHLKVYKDLAEARNHETMRGPNYSTEVVAGDVLMIKRFLDKSDTFITLVNVGSWEKKINTADICATSCKVYTASVNSKMTKGETVAATISLRPKEGVVLQIMYAPTPIPTSPPSEVTTNKNGGTASRVAAMMSVMVPVLCLLL